MESDSRSMPPIEKGGVFWKDCLGCDKSFEHDGLEEWSLASILCIPFTFLPICTWCIIRGIHGRNACISGLEWKGSLLIYNTGEPAPPGFRVTCCCGCCCCKWPALAGIPEGTPRVPQNEEREILARWQGHFKIGKHPPLPEDRYYLVRTLGQLCCGRRPFNFTDAYVQDDLLAYSGGWYWVPGSDGFDGWNVLNKPQHQKLSLWRGDDGVLYCDNVGSTVEESESETTWTTLIRGAEGDIELQFSLAEIQEIAKRATRVRIQGDGYSVTSVADTWPIHDVRRGRTIGESTGGLCSPKEVQDAWEGDTGHMWFERMTGGEKGKEWTLFDSIDKKVFHARGNHKGLHWYTRSGGKEEVQCCWSIGDRMASSKDSGQKPKNTLELLVDAPPPDNHDTSTRLIREQKLKITTALGQDLVLWRPVPDGTGEVVEGEAVAAACPNEVVVEGEVAAEEPMDRG